MEDLMRSIVTLAAAVLLSACAGPGPGSEKLAAAPAVKKGPQCYSGDHGKFFDVDEKTTITGVAVICKPTSDGKAAQWMGSKH